MASLTQAGITFGDGTSQTTAASSAFPAGTLMLFVQSAAPTGWTKSTAHNDKALRVVSGSVSSGGSVAFSTAFASQAVSGSVSIGATTLSTAQMPSHAHNYSADFVGPLTNRSLPVYDGYYPNQPSAGATSTNNTGGGGSHTHSASFSGNAINMAVQYVDVIICTRN